MPFQIYHSTSDGFIAVIVLSIGISLLYATVLVTYRAFFHPLCKIPGPRLAGLTFWYEFYHDIVRGGTYVHDFARLHKLYGPVVRISPDHVHVNDISTYHRIFGAKEDFLHAPQFYQNVGVPGSLLAIENPKVHRIRRNIINPVFTPRSVIGHSRLVSLRVKGALAVMRAKHDQGMPVDLHRLFQCFTLYANRTKLDSICKSLFGVDQELISTMSETPPLVAAIEMFTHNVMLMKHFPIIGKLARKLPDSLASMIAPGYIVFRQQCAQWIRKVKARRAKGFYGDEDSRSTVFDFMADVKPEKNYPEPTERELVDDAIVMVVAGSESTMITLTHATFHLLKNPLILQRFKEELKDVPKDDEGLFDYNDLGKLPFLMAVIKETLRISVAVPGLLPRIVPASGLQVGSNLIPAGSMISSCEAMIHHNPAYYKDPLCWNPDRWLQPSAKDYEKAYVPFSKGPRQCIGKNLAMVQISICLAMIFTSFDMELYETDEKSMEWLDKAFAAPKSHVKVLARPIS